MTDPLEDLRTRLHDESAESDAKLRQFIRTELTEDRLREDWDRLRGAHRQRETSAPASHRWDAWSEFVSALWLARLPQRVSSVAAVAILVLAVCLALPRGGVEMPADPRDRAMNPAGQPMLPDNVRVNVKEGTIEFYGGGDKLAGTLDELSQESTPAVAVFHVEVKGMDSTGLEANFVGKAFLTRAVAGQVLQSRGAIKKVYVEGNLNIPSIGSFTVIRNYRP